MIVSDGTTELTFQYADEILLPAIDRATKVTAGGVLKSQATGERIKFNVRFRTTPSGYRSLMTMLTNGATDYYYTPEETYTFYSGVSFPITVVIDRVRREWDNRKQYYVQMEVTGVNYI